MFAVKLGGMSNLPVLIFCVSPICVKTNEGVFPLCSIVHRNVAIAFIKRQGTEAQ
jgi:hypothetical protein